MVTFINTGLDGQRVIVFGGSGENITSLINDALYVLDITNFEWSVPNVSGDLLSVREQHTAIVIRNYMVIAYGKI